MKKNDLLRLIAESGYNIGFGAKLHFSTLDIVEKAPGWINVIAFIIGVYALIFPALAAAGISATLVIASALTIYVTFYNSDKQKYDEAGVSLTRSYNQLRDLYAEVKAQPDDADVTAFAQRRSEIVDAAAGLSAVPSRDEDEVKNILFDLTRRETRTYSNFFADSLMKNWASAGDLNQDRKSVV